MPNDPGHDPRQAFSKELDLWRQFGTAAKDYLEEASKRWTQAMLDTRDVLLKLADCGWYLPSSIGWDVPCRLAHEAGVDWSEVDDWMCELWSEEVEVAQDGLLVDHPRRAALLHEGFSAHETGQFFLSVPVFLSQADGVCFELLQQQLFTKDRGGEVMRWRSVIEAEDRLSQAYLAPLSTVQPIVWGRERRPSKPGLLNRHAVLHGEDVEYGTKVNSLKALSILSYANFALRLAKRASPPSADPS